MKSLLICGLTLGLIGLGSIVAQADQPGDSIFQAPPVGAQVTADSSWSFYTKGDVSVGTSVVLEHEEGGSGPELKVLVRAEYRGIKYTTKDPGVSYRYFWVWAKVGKALVGEGSEATVSSMNVHVTPVTRVNDLTNEKLRLLPMEVSSNLELHIDSNVNIQVIGYDKAWANALVGGGSKERARFTKFATVAVDLIGLRFMKFQQQAVDGTEGLHNDSFTGLQIGAVHVTGGLGWNINEAVTLRLSVGAKANLAEGPYAVWETDLYGRLDLLLKTAYGRYSVYALGGRFSHTRDQYTHSEEYVTIGVNVAF